MALCFNFLLKIFLIFLCKYYKCYQIVIIVVVKIIFCYYDLRLFKRLYKKYSYLLFFNN